jgi:hypothetical protein
VHPLGPAPSHPVPAPAEFAAEPCPRRRVVRRLKEALVKSAILCGVPHAIEASFALKDALEPGDRDTSFVRQRLELGPESARRGAEGIYKVYRDHVPIDGEIAAAMRDIGARDGRFYFSLLAISNLY